jgi:general secretion pathway protein D
MGLLLAAALLAGCAEQRIRREADEASARGAYEDSVRVLRAGVQANPESALLRSGLLQARQQAMDVWLREIQQRQGEGDFAGAQRVLERALSQDPDNPRLRALKADLDMLARQRAALAEAQAQVDKQRPDLALAVITQALQDNPRQAELLAMRRRLEADLRTREQGASREVLAQSKLVSLDFRDATLRTVLDLISRHSGVNYVVDRDVKQELRVTLLLKDALVDDALTLLLATNQLTRKVVDARTIVVYPNTREKAKEYEEQVVKVFYLSSGDAKGAATFLKSMLKVNDPFVEERTNMLAVRDSIENIRLAERLIGLYDAGEPEVLLELEVLEINTNRLSELGVKFPASLSLTPLPPAGATQLTLQNIDGLGRDRIALGLGGATVNLRRETGDFSTLANPRIRVKNKEKAKVLVGDKIPVISTVTGQTGFVSDNISYLDVGLKLEVEPSVYADDDVGIKVALEVSSLGNSVRTAAGALAYQIGTRNASTFLRLRDGETQLLAGLISKDERTSANRLPGVGDLPVVGRLFSSTLDDSKRTELMLAITPRILRNVQRPSASESEIWIGTEARPGLKPVRLVKPALAEGGSSLSVGPSASAPVSPSDQATAPRAETAAPQLLTPLKLKWQAPATAKVGEVVTLSLVAEQASDLRALPMELSFERDKWAFVGVDEGDLLSQGETPTSVVQTGQPESGLWSVSVLRRPATGAHGAGRVLNLKLRAVQPGEASIAVRSARALTSRADVAQVMDLPVHKLRIGP